MGELVLDIVTARRGGDQARPLGLVERVQERVIVALLYHPRQEPEVEAATDYSGG